MGRILRYTDRSRIEVGNRCMRELYWNYIHGGKGLVPTAMTPHLAFGLAIHSVIEFGTPDAGLPYVEDSKECESPEWAALYKGLTHVYLNYTLPQILTEYEFAGHEVEIDLGLGQHTMWMTRLDGILRRKRDGSLFVLEVKTSGHPADLMEESQRNFQLLMEIESLKKWAKQNGHDPDKVMGAFLLVFDKGKMYHSSNGNSWRISPFTSVYTETPSGGDHSFKYKSKYTRHNVWELNPIYTQKFLWDSHEAKAAVQFWPSVDFDPDMAASVRRQVVGREIAQRAFNPNDPEAIDYVYPQNFKACRRYGQPCPFYDVCFSPRITRDPIGSGEYMERMPNHKQEIQP